MLTVFASTFLWNAQPPVVLLLTSSSERTIDLLLSINNGIAPLRAVALLKIKLCQQLIIGDNLRTVDEKLWKSIVHQLIEISPIVVIDARAKSGPVAEETFLMLAPERVGKAIFLLEPDGRCPSLDAHGIDPTQHALRTVNEEALIKLLRDMTRSKESLPMSDSHFTPSVHKDIVPEKWDNLPSLLTIAIGESFDSRELIALAKSSDKDVICLWLPSVNEFTKEDAQRMLNLSWEFAYDPKLAAIFLTRSNKILIRISFLMENSDVLGIHTAEVPRGRITWKQLNQPHPVFQAVHNFWDDIYQQAKKNSYTCRYVEE
jgi:hypothetical protein